jgi:hypothetical protein
VRPARLCRLGFLIEDGADGFAIMNVLQRSVGFPDQSTSRNLVDMGCFERAHRGDALGQFSVVDPPHLRPTGAVNLG